MITINKADQLTVPGTITPGSLTYGGSFGPSTFSAGSGSRTGTPSWQYRTSSAGSWVNLTGSVPTPGAATYLGVRVTYSGDGNYNASTSAEQVITINKADQAAPTAIGGSFIYGNTYTATATEGGGQGALQWERTGGTAAGGAVDPGTGSVSAISTGTVTVRARWSGNGNYNASAYSAAVDVSVTARAITVTRSGSKSYDGTTNSTGANASVPPGGLATGDTISCSFGPTSSANADSYEIAVSASIMNGTSNRTGNYAISYAGLYTINKVDQGTVSLTPATSAVVVGSTVFYTASGGGIGGYSWGGTAGAAGSGATKNVTFNTVGNQTVTVSSPGDINRNPSNTATATIQVLDRNLDSDGDEIPDWWELQYGLDPNDSSDAQQPTANTADDLTNWEAYHLGRIPTAGGSNLAFPKSFEVPFDFTVLAKGTGTVTISAPGVSPGTFNFQPSSPTQWSEPYLVGGQSYVASLRIPVEPGFACPVTVSFSGVTDYVVKAKAAPDIMDHLRPRPKFNGRFSGAISKSEIAGGSFELTAVPAASGVPFGVADTSKFVPMRVITFGMGTSRTGEAPGQIVVGSSNYILGGASAGFRILKGATMEQFWESPTHFQAKVPDGYVEFIKRRTVTTINYYADGSYPLVGGFNDFSSATPVVSYTITYGDSAKMLRTAGNETSLFEWQLGGRGEMPGTPVTDDWQSSTVTTRQDLYEQITNVWWWRDASKPRGGLTRAVATTERTMTQFGNNAPSFQYQPIFVTISSHDGPEDTDPVLFVERQDFDQSDRYLVRPLAKFLGQGADQYAGPSNIARFPYHVDGSQMRYSPTERGNGLGGGTFTEYYSTGSMPGQASNLGGEPAIAVGEIKHVWQSLGDNAPVTTYPYTAVAGNPVTTYSYASDMVDGRAAPSAKVTKLGTTEIGRSSFSYTTGTYSGHTAITTSATAHASSASSLTTTTRAYSNRIADLDLRGKPISIVSPGNLKTSFHYERGTLSGTSWTGSTSGAHLRVVKLEGKTGTSVTSFLGSSIDSLTLEANRSAASETIFDGAGRLLREATYVYTGGSGASSFTLLTTSYAVYTHLGQLLMKADQPIAVTDGEPSTTGRVFYEARYSGFEKSWEADEAGTRVDYVYDDYGRVFTATRQALGSQQDPDYVPARVNTYEYYPTGKVKKETVSSPSETEILVTEFTYDTGGRMKDVTAPGGYVTSTTYDSAVQSTVTSKGKNATGPTTITTLYKDGRKKSVGGTGAIAASFTYTYDTSTGELTTKETLTGVTPNPWSSTVTDWLGRTVRTETPTFNGAAVRQEAHSYNAAGQLTKREIKAGSTTLAPPRQFQYDTYGRLEYEWTEVNGTAGIQLDSDMDVVRHYSDFQQLDVKRFLDDAPIHTGNQWYAYVEQSIYPYGSDVEGGTNRSGEGRRASESYTQLTGLSPTLAAHTWAVDLDRNKTQTVTTIDRANARVVSETNVSGSDQLLRTVARNGQAVQSRNAQGQTFLTSYDGLGRVSGSSDPRIVTPTTVTYKSGTALVETTTTPDLKETTNTYDNLGRVAAHEDPAGKMSYFQYNDLGLVTHTWGDVPNPVMSEYDALGREVKMHTFRSGTWNTVTFPTAAFSGIRDTTEWVYDPVSGLLKNKIAAKGGSAGTTTFVYDSLGRTTQRTDPRGWVTQYSFYGPSDYSLSLGYIPGMLKKVDYRGVGGTNASDPADTPDVEYFYHRTGKVKKVIDAAGTRTFNYYESWTDTAYEADLLNKSGALQAETFTSFLGGSGYVQTYGYQYGMAGRANGLAGSVSLNTAVPYHVDYGYDAVLRPASVRYLQNDTNRFDYAYVADSNLIDTVTRGTSTSYSYRRDYDYESLSNRMSTVQHRSAYGSGADAKQVETRVTYNSRGLRWTEMTKGTDYMAALATDPQFGYTSANGIGQEYSYSDRYEVGSVDKYQLGSTWAFNTAAAVASGDRDYGYDPIGNRTSEKIGASALASYTMKTYGTGSVSENEYLDTPYGANLTYDNNGNLLTDPNDGVARTCTYDGENRLVTLTQGGVTTTYRYDYLGRRISKKVGTTEEVRFIYDGWNLIAELNSANQVNRRFVWGLDVTGTAQGAGGVGGLLAILTSNATYMPIFDTNHNVIGLYDQNGAMAAAYEYDPFGRLGRSGGLGSYTYYASNPFRYSTKYTDSESGLIYYGQRYYAALTGRFINRDPIAELGGLNLYGFCHNNGVNQYDYLGMNGTDDVREAERRTLDEASRAASDARRTAAISEYGISGWLFHGGQGNEFVEQAGADAYNASLRSSYLFDIPVISLSDGSEVAVRALNEDSHRELLGWLKANNSKYVGQVAFSERGDASVVRFGVALGKTQFVDWAYADGQTYGSGRDVRYGVGYFFASAGEFFLSVGGSPFGAEAPPLSDAYLRWAESRGADTSSWSFEFGNGFATTVSVALPLKGVRGGGAAERIPSTTRLFRAVEKAELDDVLRYGDYNIHPNSTFKRFAFDEGSLDAFIKANPGRNYTKTFIDLPTEKLDFMIKHGDPGGVGKAIGIDVFENPQFYDWFKGVNVLGPK